MGLPEQKIKKLIEQDEINEALKLFINSIQDSSVLKDLSLQRAYLSRIQKAFNNNLINWEKYSVEKTKIISGLLSILEGKIEDESIGKEIFTSQNFSSYPQIEVKKKNNSRILWVTIVIFFAISCLVVSVIYLQNAIQELNSHREILQELIKDIESPVVISPNNSDLEESDFKYKGKDTSIISTDPLIGYEIKYEGSNEIEVILFLYEDSLWSPVYNQKLDHSRIPQSSFLPPDNSVIPEIGDFNGDGGEDTIFFVKRMHLKDSYDLTYRDTIIAYENKKEESKDLSREYNLLALIILLILIQAFYLVFLNREKRNSQRDQVVNILLDLIFNKQLKNTRN